MGIVHLFLILMGILTGPQGVRRASWRCSDVSEIGVQTQECSANPLVEEEFRMIRVIVNDDIPVIWTIYEVWLR
jgi:hypothetical protein